jgi:hypothetical protein
MKKVLFTIGIIAILVGVAFAAMAATSNPAPPPWTALEGKITAVSTQVTNLQGNVSAIGTNVTALDTKVTNLEAEFTGLQVMETDWDMVKVAYGQEDVTIVSPSFTGVVHVSLTVHAWGLDEANEVDEEDDGIWVYCRGLDKEGLGWSAMNFKVNEGLTVLEFDTVGDAETHPWSIKASNRADDVFHNYLDLTVYYTYTMTYPKS